MAAKKKAKEVKLWAWQRKSDGHLARIFHAGRLTLHTAPTRSDARASGVDPRWKIVRVSIKVL